MIDSAYQIMLESVSVTNQGFTMRLKLLKGNIRVHYWVQTHTWQTIIH